VVEKHSQTQTEMTQGVIEKCEKGKEKRRVSFLKKDVGGGGTGEIREGNYRRAEKVLNIKEL